MTASSAAAKCRNCHGALVQRNPRQLLVTGLIFCATLAIAFFAPLFWIPGIILFLAGLYLIAWATLARGMWCRQCKNFSIRSGG